MLTISIGFLLFLHFFYLFFVSGCNLFVIYSNSLNTNEFLDDSSKKYALENLKTMPFLDKTISKVEKFFEK